MFLQETKSQACGNSRCNEVGASPLSADDFILRSVGIGWVAPDICPAALAVFVIATAQYGGLW
jgi:hypothetical protein